MDVPLLHLLSYLFIYCLQLVYISVYLFIITCLYLYTSQYVYFNTCYKQFIHHSIYINMHTCLQMFSLFISFSYITAQKHHIFYILLLLTWRPAVTCQSQYHILFFYLYDILDSYILSAALFYV